MRKTLSFRLVSSLLSAVSRIQEKAEGYQYASTLKQAPKTLFKPRGDDVYIVSYPKSGTTLLQMMLYQLTTGGGIDFPHVEAVSPWYERAVVNGQLHHLEALPSPRLLKSHALHEWLPRSGRYIYVARNVRDVAVSAYHHLCLVTGVEYRLEPYLDVFLEHEQYMFGGSWFDHVASWWPHRHDDDVLFLIFEDIVGDLEGAVRQVADFLNLEIDDKRMPAILEHCSIGFMKEHNQKFDPRRMRFTRAPEEAFIVRSLTAGGEALADSQRQRLAGELEALAGELGWSAGDRDGRGLGLG